MAHVLRSFIRHVGLWWSGKCMHRIAHVVRRAFHLWSKEKWRSIYHGTCAAQFHSSFGVVLEWAMAMWWRGVVVGGWMHLNIAHVLSSMLVHMYTSLSFVSSCIFSQVCSPVYVSHLCFRIVGRHLFFLGHGVGQGVRVMVAIALLVFCRQRTLSTDAL